MKEKDNNAMAMRSAVVVAGAMAFAYVAIEMGLKPFIHHLRHSFTKCQPPGNKEVPELEPGLASKEREERKQQEEKEQNENVIAKEEGDEKEEENNSSYGAAAADTATHSEDQL